LSLGEDRYLTTLMTKHFPNMSFKFLPGAYAMTAAPESWSVLLSQRRRWINSTVHNLAELMFLEEMCGFCLFSMRFVVFLDLFGNSTPMDLASTIANRCQVPSFFRPPVSTLDTSSTSSSLRLVPSRTCRWR
jgi:cellulose synthase/poly-beta-1,6-N-acetylglucosamine synthase-like glycosyltransferase